MTEIILPELTGTPKQIKWANDLREATLGIELGDLDPAVRDETARLLATRTSARWWIETRNIHGWEWAHLLGVAAPALPTQIAQRGAIDGKVGPAWTASIQKGMDAARRIRQVLTDAGFDRLDYVIRLMHNDEIAGVGLTIPAESTSPMQDTTLRKPRAQAVCEALRAAGWRPGGAGNPDMAWRNMIGRMAAVLHIDDLAKKQGADE